VTLAVHPSQPPSQVISDSQEIRTIFWDIGGVLLTNGWDKDQRADVLSSLGVDLEAYGTVHDTHNYFWERGLSSAEDFFRQTVLLPNPQLNLTFAALWSLVCAQTKVLHPESFDILSALHRTGRYRLATLNNESRELNNYRLDAFDLRRYFGYFLCSGYLHEMKPAPGIYRYASRSPASTPRPRSSSTTNPRTALPPAPLACRRSSLSPRLSSHANSANSASKPHRITERKSRTWNSESSVSARWASTWRSGFALPVTRSSASTSTRRPPPGSPGQAHSASTPSRSSWGASRRPEPSGSWSPPALPSTRPSPGWSPSCRKAIPSSTAAIPTTRTRSVATPSRPPKASSSSTAARPAVSGASKRATR